MNNGAEIPILGLGTWNLKGESGKEAVKKAIELGYRHIDTAEMYGNETEIGEAVKGFNREELFIVSKFSPNRITKEEIISACEASLSRLKTDYLDLYLLHWPSSRIDFEEVMSALKELNNQGKIKAAGVSNFSIEDLRKILPIAERYNLLITNNQVEFNPFNYDDRLLSFCKRKGIALTAYSPLGQGKILDEPVIEEVARRYGKTPAQIILRWAIQKGTAAIPKAGSQSHLRENLDIFDFGLDKEDMEKLDDLGAVY